jgi:hypothetical protein
MLSNPRFVVFQLIEPDQLFEVFLERFGLIASRRMQWHGEVA